MFTISWYDQLVKAATVLVYGRGLADTGWPEFQASLHLWVAGSLPIDHRLNCLAVYHANVYMERCNQVQGARVEL